MKKLSIYLVAFLALAVAACSLGVFSAPAKADETLKTIDVYLLMGQSNAAGHTKVSSGDASLTSATFNNVLVGGANQPKLNGSSDYKYLDYNSLVPAKKGLGRSEINGEKYMGPEYGMAKILSEARVTVNGASVPLYDENNKAVIFKYAAGGTELLNYVDEENDRNYGNWYPRSLQNPNEKGYVTGSTGGLYNGAVKAFRTFTNNLKNAGYKVSVKGIAWMQGEDDRDKAEEYRSVIQSFVRDLREDISIITGEDASSVMFAMGEISETFRTSNQRSANQKFIKMQNEVVSALMPAVTVETGDMPINLPKNELAQYGYTEAQATLNSYGDYTVGSDQWHWNAKDMVTLGERFGTAFLTAYGNLYVKTGTSVGGSIVADKTFVSSGDSVTCTITALDGYKLSGFTVNGEDKLAEIKDGKYTAENVTETLLIEATFTPKPSYTIKIEGGKYQINKTSKTVNEGDTAYIVPSVPDGKKIKSVTFNGQPMTYNESKSRYEYANVTSNGTIVIEYEDADEIPAGDTETPTEEKGGCGGKAAVAFASVFALVAAAFVIKK